VTGGYYRTVTDPTFDEALAAPGDKLAAWNVDLWEGKRVVGLYTLVPDGAPERVAWTAVPQAEAEAFTASLGDRGCLIGHYDPHGPVWWVAAVPDVVLLWGVDGTAAAALEERMELAPDRRLERSGFARFIAFASDDMVVRGVVADLVDGSRVEIYVLSSLAAENALGYSRNELIFETEWCSSVARALARWAGCAYEDQI
jgi:hypothetical protein